MTEGRGCCHIRVAEMMNESLGTFGNKGIKTFLFFEDTEIVLFGFWLSFILVIR